MDFDPGVDIGSFLHTKHCMFSFPIEPHAGTHVHLGQGDH